MKKTTTYDIGNPGPDLRQAQECSMVKLFNGIFDKFCILFIQIYLFMFTAPQPPRRDPRTSLSKVKGKYISEELNELGAYFFFY